jgi:hypothetical protein
MINHNTPDKQTIDKEQYEILQQLEDWLEMPITLVRHGGNKATIPNRRKGYGVKILNFEF